MEELMNYIPKRFELLVDGLEWAGYVFFFFVLVELALDYARSHRSRKYIQSFVDFGVYLGHELIGKIAGASIFLATLFFFSDFSPTRLPVNWLTWATGLIVADFLYYWSHRLEHRSRFFWMWHNVHHSSTDYNATTALRLGWLEPLVSWYLLVPMVVLGFDPFQVLILFQALLTYQTWIHTQKIGKLGWFDGVFNSPSNHRAHHGSNPEYIDKNFGAVFILWDRWFGTYARETSKVRYGLTENIETNNPLKVNLHEPLALIRGLKKTKGIRQTLRWIFGPPGWRPN
jgi:sterol desaturase/sphingolipid hydroxylase (fatty acid hydroxylase superfamily)